MREIKPTVIIGHRSILLCEVLRESLEHRQYKVLAYSNSGLELQQKRRLYKPDILIISNALEGLSGIEIVEEIQQTSITNKCLFMSQDVHEAQAVKQRLDVSAHVPAFVSISEFFYALQELSEGRKYTSPVIEKMQQESLDTNTISVMDATMLQVLTPREKEIMNELAHSFTTPQIANRLFISTATVNNHRANIMQKLDIKGRNQLMSIAIALKPYYVKAA